MKPVRSGRTALIFSLLFLLFTAALSTVLYQTTKSNPSGTELSSYTLRIEAGKPTSLKSQYTFTVSCIFSESGAPCQEKSSQATVYPGIFSTITLSAPARSGSYRGIRVELLGHRGNPLQIRSVMLQDERIFDGRDISVFRNPQGLTVSQDSTSGLALLELTSDMASFELDAGFTVEGAPAAAIKYTSAVMAAVLFISGVLILSVFGASSGRGVRHRRHRGAGAILRRMSLAWISFSMLMAVAFALGQLCLLQPRGDRAPHPGKVPGREDYGSRGLSAGRRLQGKLPWRKLRDKGRSPLLAWEHLLRGGQSGKAAA